MALTACDVCGKEFESRSGGKRCSPECKRAAMREYQRVYRRISPPQKSPSALARAVAANIPDGEYDAPLPKVKRLEVDGRLYEVDADGKPHLMGTYKDYFFPVRQSLIDALEARR